MGLFGGKSEEELRTSGSPTTARVTYVDDTGKRREGGTQARVKIQLKIDSGSARGRDLDKTKWVPVTKMPHVGETVSIRFDPDDVDDWAWGDSAMYAPAAPNAMPAAPGMPPVEQPGDPMVEFIQNAAGPWGNVPGFKGMIEQAMAQSHVTWDGSSQVIDARNNPELRNQILGALGDAGIDVGAMAPPDPSAMAPPGSAPPPPGGASAEDLAARLRKLDALRDQGLLTPEEHRDLRQKIIDSI